MYDTIIIGGGISALGAAIYCGRFQLKTLVLGENLGGTIILTDEIANYPGFKKITGMDLFDKFKEHVTDSDVEIREKKVENVKKSSDCFKVSTKDETFAARSIIFATGTEWKKLNVPGEKEFEGRGVHYCALCDAPVYKGRALAIVGGSDSAAKESLLLAKYASKVYIIYRKEKIRAEPINLKKVKENKKIEIIGNTNIKEIRGSKMVASVILDKPFNGRSELKLDAVFVAIGHIPLSKLAGQLKVDLDKRGYIKTNENSETSIKGVYACGDVTNGKFKQVITGVAEGVIAAYKVYEYINDEMPVCGCSEDSQDF